MSESPGYWPAVRLSGEVYTSECCHECAQRQAAETRGWTIDKLNDQVMMGAETYELGYLNTRTEEFVPEEGK